MPDADLRESSLPARVRAMPIASIDAAARTVDVVFSTGAAVRRARYLGWDTRILYDETLVVSDAAINMERLAAGAAVLDSHFTWSTRGQMAVVDRAWVEAGRAMARLRFPSAGVDAEADRMWGLVSEGIVRNVSVGYSQDKVRVKEAEKRGDVEQWTVERWTPYEISFVAVGADPGAQTRGQPQAGAPHTAAIDMFPAEIAYEKDHRTMPDTDIAAAAETQAETETRGAAEAKPTAASADIKAAGAAAATAERARIVEITSLCDDNGMKPEFRARVVADGSSVDAVRAAILDEIKTRSKAVDPGPQAPGDRSASGDVTQRILSAFAKSGGKVRSAAA